MSLQHRAPIAALSLCLLSTGAWAQIVEDEPNNPCPAAQIVGDAELPLIILGSLDSTPEDPDVDFYRVAGVPGQILQIDLEGVATGMGTLNDPFLGFFDAACHLLATNDDSGGTLNSRLYATVPDNGAYVIGATVCCDSEFQGGGEGTYTLTVSAPVFIDSISGRAVDADTSEPLPGDAPTYALAELRRCTADGCFAWVNSQAADSDGRFIFTTDYDGVPLPVGSYELTIYANGYLAPTFGPYDVGEAQALDLGDLPLPPLELIGSISGRLVDARDGAPLAGFSPPFAAATLERCEDSGCYPVLFGFPVDEDGRFRFEGVVFDLGPGNYRILSTADDYEPFASDPFFVGNREDVDLGDLGLTPLPILFGDIVGCEILPLGGVCDFSVAVTNRTSSRYRGEAWAIVRVFDGGDPNRRTRFQIGRMGAQNPNPQRINLAAGQKTVLGFKLEIPASASLGSDLCVTAEVGRDPYPQFGTTGDRLLFCAVVQPDGASRLSAKESRRTPQLRQVREP
jgi:hypothetical protein